MSINWNPKEELQLARILFSRAISRDNPERDIEVPVLKFIEEEGPAHLVTLATEMPLCRGTTVRIHDTVFRDQNSLDYLEETVSAIADRYRELHAESDVLTAQLKLLRRHLGRRLSQWRARDLRIRGSINPAFVHAPIDRDTVPIVHLTMPDETLRMSSVEFEAYDTDMLDERLAEVTAELSYRSEMLNDLRELGAVGLIHPILEAILGNEPEREQLLLSILDDKERFQDITLASGAKVIVYWETGVLTCTHSFDDELTFKKDEILLKGDRMPAKHSATPLALDDLIQLPIQPKAQITATRIKSSDARGTVILVEAMALLIMADGTTKSIEQR